MAKDYTIRAFKIGDFQDPHGNTWCDAVFEGEGEPIKMVVKDPTKYSEGMTVYGEIKEQQSKAGKPYQRFYREQQPDQRQSSFVAKKEWQPRDDSHIRAQWAIGQSMTHFAAKPEVKLEDVEVLAKALFEMVDRVKVVTDSQAQTNPGETKTFSNGEPLPNPDPNDRVYDVDPDAPIDLSQIPF